MKIYTKTGDQGQSSLFNGERRSKDDPIFAFLGQIDGLISLIGTCYIKIKKSQLAEEAKNNLKNELTEIQKSMMASQAEVAKTPEVRDEVTPETISQLENRIDFYTENTKPLTNFILPGGSDLGSQLHYIRTQCRNCERIYVSLAEKPANPNISPYLNRLSDYFFALARWINEQEATPEQDWQ